MVNLSGPVSAGGLRPQGQIDVFSPKKEESKAQAALDTACVKDLASPHRGAARAARPDVVASPADPVTPPPMARDDSCEETPEPCLVRSPSGSKMVNPATRFPFGASFTFWLRRADHQSPNGKGQAMELEALGSCSEVIEFWKYWNGITLDRLPPGSLLAIFRHPDRPRVGPKAPGGKWVICPSTKEAASIFEELTLALVGGEFDEASEGAPCGVALAKAENQMVVEVWNRCADETSTAPVLSQLRGFVGEEVSIEFRPHRSSNGTEATLPSAANSPKRAQATLGRRAANAA